MKLHLYHLGVIAAQELKVMLRTRWIGGFALLFFCLVTGFAWFGTADLGLAGIQGFSRTAVSLVNLVASLVPLLALLAGLQSLSLERGGEDQLYSQPVSRNAVVLGKALGLFAALSLSLLIGFGSAGLVIALRAGTEGLPAYLAFAGLSLLLEAVFLSLALLLSGLVRARLRALGAGLAVWFFFVFLFDLAVIGSTLVLRGPWLKSTLFLSVFLNPVDMVRISQLIALGGSDLFGPAGAAWIRFCGGTASLVLLVSSSLVLWIAIPAAAGLRAFGKRDL